MKPKELAGLRFGSLMVLDVVGRKDGRLLWKCLCDCGAEKLVVSNKLNDRRSTACTCVRDLTNKRFGLLLVTGRTTTARRASGANSVRQRDRYITRWSCLCDCGNTATVAAADLIKGHTKSCGHLRFLNMPALRHGHNRKRKTTKVYNAWSGMLQRCRPEFKQHIDYYDRGITVCARWKNNFEDFLSDVGEPPYPNWSLDRIDNDGNYEPGNVRWAPDIIQDLNRRKYTTILSNGCQRLGITVEQLFDAFLDEAA